MTYKNLFKSLLSVLLGIYPVMELLNHMDILSAFLSICHTVFHSVCTILHFYQQCTNFLISPHPHQRLILFIFFSSPNNSDPNGCDMISPECDVVSHCGLIYIFLRMSYIEHTISLESTKTHGLESQGSTASRPVWAGTLPAQHPCLQHPAGVHLPATPWLSPAEVRGRGDFWCSTDQSPWMQSRVGKWGDDIWKGKWKLFYHSNMLMTTILNPLQNPVQWWDHGRQ